MAELCFAGLPASPGIAAGRIRLEAGTAGRSAGIAKHSLPEAIDAAIAELKALQAGLEPTAAEIVQFQIAMLEDPELVTSALADIARGGDAAEAFRAAIQVQIDDFSAAASEMFQARTADLKDLRDRVLRVLTGEAPRQLPAGDGTVLVCEELTPTDFVAIDWSRMRGAALFGGSPASHVAMLARAYDVPLVTGLERDPAIRDGRPALLDGEAGMLVLDPERLTLSRREAHARRRGPADADADKPAITRDGAQVSVYLNVDALPTLDRAPPDWFDGIGLTRTELLFSSRIPDEAEQAAAYRALFDWAGDKPVTIRLFDAGGDKPMRGLIDGTERNPFLGVRGVRLLLRHREVLRTQMRAILAAAAERPVRIMIPMVAVPEEFNACRTMLDAVLAEMGVERAPVLLGMMVETPAAALGVERFEADFLSIGTNDLTQYVMAAARDCAALDYLQMPAHPAVLELVRRVAAHGRASGRHVSVCGEAASRGPVLQALLSAGVRALSISAAAVPAAKAAIRTAETGP